MRRGAPSSGRAVDFAVLHGNPLPTAHLPPNFEFDPDYAFDEGAGALRVNGKIRLHNTRRWFLENWNDAELINVYQEWVDQNEYLHFAVYDGDKKKREIAVLCSKRGNSVYRYRVKNRVSPLLNLDLPGGNRSWNKTRLLFVTLTYNTRLASPRGAWVSISKEFNRWISNVRNKFGGVSYLKVFESTKRGYPHIHLILVFKEAEFSYFALNGKFRIPRKERDKIAGNWRSFVDIEAVVSPKQAIAYMLKYLLKVHGEQVKGKTAWEISQEGVSKTLALLWVLKKRGYSLSGDIERVLTDSIPMPCVTQTFQITLEGKKLERWVLLGIKTASELGITDNPPPFTVVLWEKKAGA